MRIKITKVLHKGPKMAKPCLARSGFALHLSTHHTLTFTIKVNQRDLVKLVFHGRTWAEDLMVVVKEG